MQAVVSLCPARTYGHACCPDIPRFCAVMKPLRWLCKFVLRANHQSPVRAAAAATRRVATSTRRTVMRLRSLHVLAHVVFCRWKLPALEQVAWRWPGETIGHFVLSNSVVACEMKLFQNYFTGSLQLVNIFRHVQCRWNNFEIISAAEIMLK